jgi:Secretion system C-terminal sorting domain
VLGADGMVPLIHPSNPNIYYAGWQGGEMAKSTDGGASYIYGVVDTIQAVDPGPWVTQYAMSPTNPNEILTARTDVWRTTNGMQTWRKISNFTAAGTLRDPAPANVVVYAPSNTNHIWVGKTSLFKTINGGTTWTKITTPFTAANVVSIAINPTNPNVVWVTLIGFTAAQKVFRTTDGGTTWTNMGSNLPNTPINCVLLDDQSTNDAVYIGTDIGVFYRNNTMTTWLPFNLQLPIVIVNQLKIQPQQRLLYGATFGRGVWRSQLRDNLPEKGANLVAKNNTTLPTSELFLSPNPSVGTLNVQYLAKNNAVKSLEISDLYGRSLITKTQVNSSETIDLKNLPTGTYFVKLNTENGLVTQRFVLQR